jgi:hypothetical protein
MGVSAAKEAVASTGESLRGLDVSGKDIVNRTITEGITGGLEEAAGQVAGELTGEAASLVYKWLGSVAGIGKHLRNIRLAGGTGLKPSKATRGHIKEMIEESDPTLAVAHVREIDEIPMPKLRKQVLSVVREDVDDLLGAMGDDNKMWHKVYKNVDLNTEPVLTAIQKAVKKAEGIQRDLSHTEVVNLGKVIRNDIFPGANNAKIAKVYDYFLKHPYVNLEQLDKVVKDIDYLTATTVTEKDSLADQNMKLIQSAIRRVRDQLGTDGNYAKVKAEHSRMFQEIRNTKELLGISDDINPASSGQQKAVERFLREGTGPAKYHSEQLERLRLERPEFEQSIREAASSKSYREMQEELAKGYHWMTRPARKVIQGADMAFGAISKLKGRGPGIGLGIEAMMPPATGGTAADQHAREVLKIPQEEIDKLLESLP